MIVEKSDKIYSVSEYPTKWVVKLNSGKLPVSYDVSKELCSTEDDIREYIQASELF